MKVSITETKQDPLVLLRDVALGFFVVLPAKACLESADSSRRIRCDPLIASVEELHMR
jgi:hypothetical protein